MRQWKMHTQSLAMWLCKRLHRRKRWRWTIMSWVFSLFYKTNLGNLMWSTFRNCLDIFNMRTRSICNNEHFMYYLPYLPCPGKSLHKNVYLIDLKLSTHQFIDCSLLQLSIRNIFVLSTLSKSYHISPTWSISNNFQRVLISICSINVTKEHL